MVLGGGHPASDSCLEQGPGAQCSVAPVHRVPPPGGHTLHSISTQPGGWDGHIPTHCLQSVCILTIFVHYENLASQKEYIVNSYSIAQPLSVYCLAWSTALHIMMTVYYDAQLVTMEIGCSNCLNSCLTLVIILLLKNITSVKYNNYYYG